MEQRYQPPATNQTPRRMLPICVPIFSPLFAMKNKMPVTTPSTARMMLLFGKETPPRWTRPVRISQVPRRMFARSS